KSGDGESRHADEALERGFHDSATESVLIEGRHGSAPEARMRSAAAAVEAHLGRLDFVRGVEGPYRRSDGDPGLISPQGKAAIVRFRIPDDEKIEPTAKVPAALAAVAAVQRKHPDLRVEEVGDASAERAISDSLGEDFSKAEMTSLPVTLLILVVVFGSLVA